MVEANRASSTEFVDGSTLGLLWFEHGRTTAAIGSQFGDWRAPSGATRRPAPPDIWTPTRTGCAGNCRDRTRQLMSLPRTRALG